MRHLVICGAWVSHSPDVTLFLQLCKTSCIRRTDIPHMFFSFCDSVSLIVSIFPPASLIFFILWLLSLSPIHLLRLYLCLSPSQTLLITWQWKTSPSRSSCWPLGWPLLASEASPHLRLRPWGATWSSRSLWHLLFSRYITTDQCTHTLPSALYLRI